MGEEGSCNIPGICPNMSASPPIVSLSNLILVGRKEEFSMKNSFLIPSIGGGIKTPKSCNKQSDSKDTCRLWNLYTNIINHFSKYFILWSILHRPPQSGARRQTFTASWRTWPIVFGPLSVWALRGTQLFSRSSTVFCSRKRILAGSSLLVVKECMRPKYWFIKDWNENFVY